MSLRTTSCGRPSWKIFPIKPPSLLLQTRYKLETFCTEIRSRSPPPPSPAVEHDGRDEDGDAGAFAVGVGADVYIEPDPPEEPAPEVEKKRRRPKKRRLGWNRELDLVSILFYKTVFFFFVTDAEAEQARVTSSFFRLV
jgi:hypothetical protein